MVAVPRRVLTASLGSLLATGSLTAPAAAPAHAQDVTLTLLSVNDFHGRIDANTVKVAGTIEQLRAEGGEDTTVLLSNGDNIGASLFASAVADDIPTLDVLNALELDASAAGNHEFDRGADDLVTRVGDAADFPYLAANVLGPDGEPILPAFEIVEAGGMEVAIVGAVTEETPSLVSPGGVEGLTFADPTTAVNETVEDLQALPAPPDVIVAQIHDGAPDGGSSYEEAVAASPTFREIAEGVSPEVDAIFTGHTHQEYAWDAPVPGSPGETRPIVQSGSYGANIGEVTLTVDATTGDVTAYSARNVPRTTTDDATLVNQFPRVGTVQAIVQAALEHADDIGREVKGTQTADITRAFNGASEDRGAESTLGGVVADALLSRVSQTQAGADLGLVNPGGLRADLLYAPTGQEQPGEITYAEANAVLPFVNNVSSVAVTGETLKRIFEQQWQRDAEGNVPSRAYLQLGVSENVSYTFDSTRPEGDRITGVWIDGEPLDPQRTYRIATFSFLAQGGDNFHAFTEGTNTDTGLVDYEAWIDYLENNRPISPDFARRSVEVQGLQDEYAAGDTLTFTLPRLDLTSLGSPANTEVAVEALPESGEPVTLGSFPVSGGAAQVEATLPADLSGAVRFRATAQPTGTTVTTRSVTVSEPEQPGAGLQATAKPTRYPAPARIQVTAARDARGVVTVAKNGLPVGAGYLKNGRAIALTLPFVLRPGTHELTVTHWGDRRYERSSVPVTVEVKR
ncbi:bifunctional metallophosphatase/5'-nucleotidase [Aeromicrobium phragmitis]|uniref:Bifunctional metallophosphatase/5'-nucleotidase n=1 Tax=Aeromicrobium phragmitis TaxID=2478914 RepID=A0A3L8PK22_9ACTN|nr:bifunctional UDP-sugar hydrolase/5'-nucleotidase [Aeromicrobium phragmitis]RLV55580.1 bifunctional metallophosphatase/5'-nucleotidase [Aeromicrobium phragmitis]